MHSFGNFWLGWGGGGRKHLSGLGTPLENRVCLIRQKITVNLPVPILKFQSEHSFIGNLPGSFSCFCYRDLTLLKDTLIFRYIN